MAEMKRDTPCVYFVSDGQGHCKVGVASDIVSRLNNLQVGSAYELNLLLVEYTNTISEAYELENEYHTALRSKCVRGEWFEETAVSNYIKHGSVDVDPDKTYMCDECSEFNLVDAMNIWLMGLQSQTAEEFAERYENEVPDYWKEYDTAKKIGYRKDGKWEFIPNSVE